MTAHRLVARNDILDRSGQKVAIMRQARGKRRAVVEDEFLSAFTDLQRFFKGILLLEMGLNMACP
jgi:hypothetical protein